MSAIFTFPNRILFGAGTRTLLAGELAQLGVRHPLVVTDAGLQASGLVAEVITDGGLDRAVLFRDVHANPTEEDVLAGLDRYRTEGCDGVIGLGGGSPIDTAKGIRLLVTHPGCLADYDVAAGGA